MSDKTQHRRAINYQKTKREAHRHACGVSEQEARRWLVICNEVARACDAFWRDRGTTDLGATFTDS